MLNFTSSVYLGLRHPSWTLRPWPELTKGAPAALNSPPGSAWVEQELATLQGCERASLATSTLHLFWDLFGALTDARSAINLDAGAYPIATWGAEHAAGQGLTVRRFAHYEPGALQRLVETDALDGKHPIVVADGFCPGCGRPAPVAQYLGVIRRFGGRLVLDDTQALGIYGYSPGSRAPYGSGGGGSLRWGNVRDPNVLLVCSLAKAFGVPMAVISGSEAMVRAYEARSETRAHCSPPSVAAIHAAEHALSVNAKSGDKLRLRLAQLVVHFRKRIAEEGFAASGGLFPVQTLAPIPDLDAATIYDRLLQRGIRPVLHCARNGCGARVSFIITARHRPADIDLAAGALMDATYSVRAIKSWEECHEPRI